MTGAVFTPGAQIADGWELGAGARRKRSLGREAWESTTVQRPVRRRLPGGVALRIALEGMS